MADSFGVEFYEVSAKNNCNITETFTYLAKQIKQKILSADEPTSNSLTKDAKINIGKNSNKSKDSCC